MKQATTVINKFKQSSDKKQVTDRTNRQGMKT